MSDLPRTASDALVFDASAGIERLIEIMARLRAPDGCPWDKVQDFRSIAPYTIEEACEVAEAIERGDRRALQDELGDLLLQVVYHARMAEEEGSFTFADVVRSVCAKMVGRHPHVFGDGKRLARPEDVDWEGLKGAESAEKGETRDSVLDGVPVTLSGLTRALKLTKRAATVGFDWTDPQDVLAKLNEETAELVDEIGTGDASRTEEEYGDLIFVMVNLARHLKVDPESALRRANGKFERRFRAIETALKAEGRSAAEASLEEMEALWTLIKRAEKSASSS
jgi:ATP diphosphatase